MSKLTSQSLKQLEQWNNAAPGKIEIRLNTTGRPEDEAFKTVAEQIGAHADNLKITQEETEKPLPGFIIKDNIDFHAFPLEKELGPFLDAVSMTAATIPPLEPSLAKVVSKIEIPVHLKLYIALMCPHCPGMVRTLVPLALANENIRLEIIDGSLFTDAAQKDRVMAAPCLILDDGFRWTGSVDLSEIIEMIVNRDPGGLSALTLKNILEQGDASWITRQMIDSGKIFSSFIELLLHDTWSVRLGAMVAVEEMAELDPELALELCPPLMSVFDEKDITIQGDILYALGEAGSPETIEWIKTHLDGIEHPDLLESAQDAIERLGERHG